MSSLALFVVLYMLVSIGIGVYASRRVKGSGDYVVAGRSLPIYVTIATVFATWFGSESVLGIPATFIEEGLGGTIADPFGASLCLVFVGIFFAARLYRMKLLTIGDFYRRRYGNTVEILVSLAICISYLGWVSAQIVALGLVINIVSGDAISFELGMVMGVSVVMFYTILGGMWSVALTDFFQMVIILVGLVSVAVIVAGSFDGGALEVVDHAVAHDKFNFWPEMNFVAMIGFFGAFITMALGSVPQQDVFQRVMSAKNEKTAVYGTVIGGTAYFFFTFIPIFIVYGATMLHPELLEKHMGEGGDYQRILPEYILGNVPFPIQVLFFGALLSAVMSTASGTLLAPSAVIAENILKHLFKIREENLLLVLRLTVFCFGLVVLLYAYLSSSAGLSIFEMVENAYLVTLCGAFVPLAAGVYWKRANNKGALMSIALGVISWAVLEGVNVQVMAAGGEELMIPPQVVGLFMAIIGMIVGSYLPQKGHTHEKKFQEE
ncbi:MAG: sodium:solute symporter family protein [Rhodospirillales bacterium]|nr:sodium:solute symporter family protein [Rhodospirillales bacterium]MCB9965619.1 sodium:solute symporter family protein [Rhodospirillales bacterium]MCB9973042.1 sodium:solute symporter family protein [Rhodospirillales bacterium]